MSFFGSESSHLLTAPARLASTRLSRHNLGPSSSRLFAFASRPLIAALPLCCLLATEPALIDAVVALAVMGIVMLALARKSPVDTIRCTIAAVCSALGLLCTLSSIAHLGLAATAVVTLADLVLPPVLFRRRQGALPATIMMIVALLLVAFDGEGKHNSTHESPHNPSAASSSGHHDHHGVEAVGRALFLVGSGNLGSRPVGVITGLLAVLVGVFRKRLSAREAAGKDDGKKDGEGDRFVGLAALGAAILLAPLSLVWDGPISRSVPVTAWHHLLAAVVFGAVGLVGAYHGDIWFARRVEDPGVAAPVAAGSVLAALAGLVLVEALPAPSLPVVGAALMMLFAVTLATRGTQDSLDLLLPVDASAHHNRLASSAPAGRAFNPYPARSWQSVAHSVVSNADSRRIFIFLCINFTFMFVEFVYGFYTNSLSLISDASHMLFDCMALAIGLVAAVVSKWETDHQYSYGYGRFEVLSGFCNGLLLVFIAAFVLMEGVERLIDPPVVHTENLMVVAVCGFCVNLVGLYAFHDFGGEGHENDNMHGVFLHILADTLGSLGVILSAFLMQMYDFRLADPIASLFISVLITLSVIPLLKHSGQTLLQRTPSHLEKRFDEAITAILATPGVLVVRDPHCWLLQGTDSVATATVQVHESVPEATALASAFAIMKSKGFRHVAIQIEKGEPLDQLAVTHYGEDIMHNGHSHSHSGGHSHSHGDAAHSHGKGACTGHDHGQNHGHNHSHDHDHSGHDHSHHDNSHAHAHPYSPTVGEYRTIQL